MSMLASLALKAANTSMICHSDDVFCLIIRLTTQQIVDAALTLIARMGQRACHYLFNL